MLLPALNRGKMAARSTTCKSNVRQWSIALRMYADDFQVYPACLMADKENGDLAAWHQRLLRYTKSPWYNWDWRRQSGFPTGIQVCPDYARSYGEFTLFAIGSYAYNSSGFWAPDCKELGLGAVKLVEPGPSPFNWNPSEIRLVREAEVIKPSDMIALGDARLSDYSVDGDATRVVGFIDLSTHAPDAVIAAELGFPGIWPPDALRGARWIRGRHTGHWNVAFCDAHVEQFTTKALFDPRWVQISPRWNRDNQPHPEYINHWLR
jgi:prepilin-type processing-associated H-X9-DG protein